jgi:hypothetical protein
MTWRLALYFFFIRLHEFFPVRLTQETNDQRWLTKQHSVRECTAPHQVVPPKSCVTCVANAPHMHRHAAFASRSEDAENVRVAAVCDSNSDGSVRSTPTQVASVSIPSLGSSQHYTPYSIQSNALHVQNCEYPSLARTLALQLDLLSIACSAGDLYD